MPEIPYLNTKYTSITGNFGTKANNKKPKTLRSIKEALVSELRKNSKEHITRSNLSIPIKVVQSSGEELPTAMKLAPATSA